MIKLIGLLCVFLLSGCATELKPHVTEHYKDVTRMEKIDVTVEEYHDKDIQIKSAVVGGETLGTLTKTDLDKLRDFRAAARKNAEVLGAVLVATNAMVQERNSLLDMAKMEERRANDLEVDLARTEDKLRNEEKMRLYEGLFYKVLIVIGVAATL